MFVPKRNLQRISITAGTLVQRPRERLTKEIGHDVITDHQTDRNNEPEDALKGVLDTKVGGEAKEEQGDVGPRELRQREGHESRWG